MRRCFVDTNAFIALADKSDRHHDEAILRRTRLDDLRLPLVTTSYVFAETVTWLRRRLGHPEAVRFGDAIGRGVASGKLEVVYPDAVLEREAWELFLKHQDQSFSFVDCVSFAWLRRHPTAEALAFDAHFAWIGFRRFEG
jgi:predicted nucleic acid-binding protein